MAGQIGWGRGHVHRSVGSAMVNGGEPDEVASRVLARLDVFESLLGEQVLEYASRPAE